MKHFNILLVTVFSLFFNLTANDTISSNELLKLLKKNSNVYETVFSLEASGDIYHLDYKEIQGNNEVKNYLLKLLDVNEYIDFQSKRYAHLHKSKLENFLSQNFRKSFVDSVYKTPSLLKFYSDSVRKNEKKEFYKEFYYDGNICVEGIDRMFSNLRYPEVYDKTLENLKVNENSKHFRTLLRIMQDTLEWKRYVLEVKNDIADGKLTNTDLSELKYEWAHCDYYGSCGILFFISMLDEKAPTFFYIDNFTADSEDIPYNVTQLCESSVISNYLFRLEDSEIRSIYLALYGVNKDSLSGPDKHVYFTKKLEAYPCPIYFMGDRSFSKISDLIIQNKDHFIKALEPLKEKYDKENEWWRSKITYRK